MKNGFDMGHVHSNKELGSVRIHILAGCQDRHRGGRRDVRLQIETDAECRSSWWLDRRGRPVL